VRRSTGVTINAVVLLVASGLTFVYSLVAFVRAFQSSSGGHPEILGGEAVFACIVLVFIMGLAGWGIATGVGLLRLRRWARTCSVVVSAMIGLLIALSLIIVGAVFVYEFRTTTPRPDFGVGEIISTTLFGFAAIYCGWWAYFFQTKSIKEEFGVKNYVPASASALFVPPAPAAIVLPPVPSGVAKPSRRPVSIAIIAALFLISAGGAVIALPMYPLFHTPAPFFGFLLIGWSVPLIMLATGGLGAATGFGLLKMKMWARTLAIYFLLFGLVNSLVTLLRPASMSRLEDSMVNMQVQFMPNQAGMENFRASAESLFHAWFRIFMPAMLIFGVILAVVQIWLLVTRKQAFINANQSSDANL